MFYWIKCILWFVDPQFSDKSDLWTDFWMMKNQQIGLVKDFRKIHKSEGAL